MTAEDHKKSGGNKSAANGKESPDWANGLRDLYDSVVDEPLPDSFKDLLAKLDEGADKNRQSKSN